jgi:hypothetical protein
MNLILVSCRGLLCGFQKGWSDGSVPTFSYQIRFFFSSGVERFFPQSTHPLTRPRTAHVKGSSHRPFCPIGIWAAHYVQGRDRTARSTPAPCPSNLPLALSDHLDHLITLIESTPPLRLGCRANLAQAFLDAFGWSNWASVANNHLCYLFTKRREPATAPDACRWPLGKKLLAVACRTSSVTALLGVLGIIDG